MDNKKEEKKENKNNLEAEALRGRPGKGEKKLSCSINLKLTAKDFKTISEKAKELGMKATGYAREMVLRGKVKSRYTLEQLDLMRKLSGMANNLNQIAKQANKTGFSNSAMEVIRITEQIKKLFHDR